MRLNAIKALSVLTIRPDATAEDMQAWTGIVSEVFRTLSVHLFDPISGTRQSILTTIKAMGARYPEQFLQVFSGDDAAEMACKDELEELRLEFSENLKL